MTLDLHTNSFRFTESEQTALRIFLQKAYILPAVEEKIHEDSSFKFKSNGEKEEYIDKVLDEMRIATEIFMRDNLSNIMGNTYNRSFRKEKAK